MTQFGIIRNAALFSLCRYRHKVQWLFAKRAKADAQLNGVDSGVRIRHAGVGNVLETNLGAEVVFFAEKVRAKAAGRREVDLRRALGNVGIREKCSAFD